MSDQTRGEAMAKNTGRGTRAGAGTGRTQMKSGANGLWIERDTTSGKFVHVKKSGGALLGVRKEK